jgi:hypothetical protein
MDVMSRSEYMASHRVSTVTSVRLAVWSHSTCRGNKFVLWSDGLDSTLDAALIFQSTYTGQLSIPDCKHCITFREA